MSAHRPRIRNQLVRDVTLGEQFRDTQQSLDSIPVQKMRRVEMVYAEPMVLGGLTQQPEAIEVIRVLDLATQETALHCGGLCHFVWKPAHGGARIDSVDGMSVAANGGKKYRFSFRITYAPEGGFNG